MEAGSRRPSPPILIGRDACVHCSMVMGLPIQAVRAFLRAWEAWDKVCGAAPNGIVRRRSVKRKASKVDQINVRLRYVGEGFIGSSAFI